jgi:DNA polymerase-1
MLETAKKLGGKLKVEGNPSFKGEDLLPFGVEPDMQYFPHVLVQHNKLQKLKRDFVDRLEDFMVQGRIHPTINPYGTKTGRPSANTPNHFQIPKRGRGKKICRVLFLPEEGEVWASGDYSSEEYRVFAHYAVGRGSDDYRHKYNTEDNYDMHIENARLAGCDRPKAKTIGLGVLFGMGATKMAVNLGMGEAKGLAIVKRFHEVNPSFKATSKLVESRAKSRGYIFTMLGRRRRFPKGEGAYRAGLWDKMNFLLFLYDEYDISIKKENLKYLEDFKQIAENAIKFRVKMNLEMETGPSWGDCK